MWECWANDYKTWQAKLAKCFDIPNDKSAETNTKILRKWQV